MAEFEENIEILNKALENERKNKLNDLVSFNKNKLAFNVGGTKYIISEMTIQNCKYKNNVFAKLLIEMSNNNSREIFIDRSNVDFHIIYK